MNERGWRGPDSPISYARHTPYWTLNAKHLLLGHLHEYYIKRQPAMDTLYLLNVLPFGQLQRFYGAPHLQGNC